MNEEFEQDVLVGDDTPPIKKQAEARGWACDYFSFGKVEHPGCEFFNPGLVRRPDGLWLLVRRSELVTGMWYGRNGIWACKLDENRIPLGGPQLRFPDSKGDEQFEDPRAVYWNGQTWIGCANFTWFPDGSWTGAHQMIGVFVDKSGGPDITEESWTPLARRDPIVGTNKGTAGHTEGKHNKNLTYFFLDNKLHCVYTSDPWLVVEFGSKWEEQTPHIGEGPKWNYGLIRGGTPPVLVGDLFYTFFHSSLPWRGRYRRYYMGAMAFESKPPFKPVYWTREPLLVGSQNDIWHQRKPLVVFPCGAICENDKWLVTLGVNDLKSAWIEIPDVDLSKLLKPVEVIPGLSLLSDATTPPERERIPFELPVPSLAESTPDAASSSRREPNPAGVGEAGESETKRPTSSEVAERLANDGHSPGGQNSTKPRGRPRKDGLPPGSVPAKPKRRYRKRRKKKKR